MTDNGTTSAPPTPPVETASSPQQGQQALRPIPFVDVESDKKVCMILESVVEKKEE